MKGESFYRDLLLSAFERFPPYPEGRYRGRGIVLCAGGLAHLANAFVCMKFLRESTDLPIELFHAGEEEMPAVVRKLLEDDFAPLVVRDITEPALQAAHPFLSVRSFRGFQIKSHAILHASFEEAFYIDADNIPLRSPEPLFASEEYRRTGAVFWPDLDRTRTTSEELFRVFGVTSEALKRGVEFESGQIVLDKLRCWKALLTTCLANSDVEGLRDYCYRHTMGDKDTFRLAFQLAAQPYHLVPHPPRGVGTSFLFIPLPLTERRLWIQHDLGSYFATGMLQHDLAGEPLFIHKTVCPWDVWLDYRNLRDIEGQGGTTDPLPLLSECEERGYGHLEEFKRRYLPAFPRDRARELQGLAASGIRNALDGVLHVRRLLRSSPAPE